MRGVGLAPDQLAVLDLERLEFGPVHAFAGEGEHAADGIGAILDLRSRAGGRFVKAQSVAGDDQQPLGVAARGRAVGGHHAPAAAQRLRNGAGRLCRAAAAVLGRRSAFGAFVGGGERDHVGFGRHLVRLRRHRIAAVTCRERYKVGGN